MFNKLLKSLKNLDWILLSAVALLSGFGLVEIYSISLSRGGDFGNFEKQAIFVTAGLLAILVLAAIDASQLKGYWFLAYLAGALALAGVLVFGSTLRGTRGWYLLGPLSIQPVEFAKIALLAALARYFAGLAGRSKTIGHILASAGGSGLYLALVMLQPDLGSAMMLMSIWAALLFLSGAKARYFLAIALVVLAAGALSWGFFLEDYQKDRIMTFINPRSGDLEEGYNVAQAAIAVGSGRLAGRGVGFGSQSQLKFLPEAQNDFIFAVIAEELGFLGTSLVIFLFGIIFYRLLLAARRSIDNFGAFFLAGAAALIFTQMFVNIGMNIGLLPVVGISLPFLSYGGSAILAFFILIGLAQSLIVRSKIKY